MAFKTIIILFIIYLLFVGLTSISQKASPSKPNAEPVNSTMVCNQTVGDRVECLPGQPIVDFKHYAGYVNLNVNKSLFYWFFEAQTGASDKPLVLWLNGGPGCSSIASGAAQEIVPFLIRNNDSELTLNQYSWNKEANMLFLDAPVGVGYSYTNNSDDYHNLGDQVSANDSYLFLFGWFKRFPQFKTQDFYIAGESYAGHFAPQLAEHIYDKNKEANEDSFMNLKGVMIGNPVIDGQTDYKGWIDFAWAHAIISDKLYQSIYKECAHGEKLIMNTTRCFDQKVRFDDAYRVIDVYGIYSPLCLVKAPRVVTGHPLTKHLWYKPQHQCFEENVLKYFNREDVQRDLHANVTKLPYPYTSCSGVIMKWKDSVDNMLPVMRNLLNSGLRIWIYSGDTDGRVPITSTRYSIRKMDLKLKEEWRAWFYNYQVAGWVETYEEGLTLATVHGADHQVLVFAPEQSLMLFSHFLNATALPSCRF